MTNDAFEYIMNWNKTSFDAMKKLAENNMRMSEKLMQEQMNLCKSMSADSAKMMETMSSAKDPQDIMKKQSAMAEETGKQIMKSAHTCADILAEAGKSYGEMFQANMEAANKAATSAAKKAA